MVNVRRDRTHIARVPLTHEERTKLAMIAQYERRTRGEVLRQAFAEYVAKSEKERQT